MKALSLFSGIMGMDLACEWAGIETVAMCERDPFCQKVIRKHKPNIPLYDDVCTLTKARLEEDGIDCNTIDLEEPVIKFPYLIFWCLFYFIAVY